MNKKILFLLIIILITSLACSFNVNLPKIATQNKQTFDIKLPIPNDRDESELEISMGAGELNLSGGSDMWISGEINYNIPLWEPEIYTKTEGVRISQKAQDQFGFPDNKIVNDWNIQLGEHPTDLEINAGAYRGNLDLSGIPLTRVSISDGASQGNIKFDQLNPVEMSSLHYKTGASQVDIIGLGNANVENIYFDAGPGSYTLDFSGDLQRDINIEINYGLGDMKIIIPEGVPTIISVDGGLNNVELRGTWNVSGNEYTLEGSGPQLTFDVNLGLGNLQLITQ
jgi:hypothetical protein